MFPPLATLSFLPNVFLADGHLPELLLLT